MPDTAPLRNRLAEETSPYLLQHADNPVHWQAWGPEALALAARLDRPILLSVGYAACHWCHVMAHESFEDPDIAAVMNGLFVNVKVDREERPDIDHIYMSALHLLGQQGGWPLTMFLTPKGEPFWGGTYFPATPRYGRPGFPDVLRGVARAYREDRDKVAHNVDALTAALAALGQSRPSRFVPTEAIDQVASRLLQEIDPVHGGIGEAPKFPQPQIFQLLWRAGWRSGDATYRTAVLHSLTRICQGGIYDHLGGGLARYSVDGEWLVPHFEKMLYDTAGLLSCLALVWPAAPEPLFRDRAEESVAWLLREMVAENGAFAASLDADSEGEEGRFYVWSEDEIDRVLGRGADAALFKRVYEVTAAGNWEGKVILNRRHSLERLDAAEEAALAACRARLLAARDGRVRPGWDDKVLADWNGLAIAALAEAALAFDRPDWLDPARRAFDAVRRDLTRDGRLHHAWRAGRLGPRAMLDDLAAMALAALALEEAERAFGRDPGDALAAARGWVAEADAHFWDGANGGYFFTADDAEALLVRSKTVFDNPTPSGNGLMLRVLSRLFYLTGDPAYGDRADAAMTAFSGELARNIFPLATFLLGCEDYPHTVQIVIVGAADDPATRALADTARRRGPPTRLLTLLDPAESLPPDHPAAGKGLVEGRPTAYVCRDLTCRPPLTDPVALGDLLDQER